MKDITIRCCVILACGATFACASGPDSVAEDSTDTADTTDTTDTAETTETTDPTDPTDTTSSTSTDSTDTSSSDDTTGEAPPDLPVVPPDPNEDIPPLDEEGCPALYAQDLLPTFELTLTPEVWNLLLSDYANGQINEDLELETHPNHPLTEFKYNDIIIEDAMIRLRGNPTYWEPGDKMQFQIDFNEVDKYGRFLGLRALALDSATYNRHMLRDRLALSIMRDMGITAPCANNARLNINGEYYGIFTNIEKLDKSFLERVFDDPTGDLWKRANWEIKTNEDTTNSVRLASLKASDTIAELETYLDLERSLPVFAAEAIIPDSDGMWAGGLNFYLYDEPISGKFLLLPWDLDNTFERFNDPADGEYPANPDPITWEKVTTHGRPWYDLALQDPEWFDFYLAALQSQFDDGYQAESLHSRIDEWTQQIQDSVFEDTNKQYSNNLYLMKVAELHAYVQARADFLHDWLSCWEGGGVPDSLGGCLTP